MKRISGFWQQVKHVVPYLALLLVLILALSIYRSAVTFGFIWDDPVWYGHAWGKVWWETLLPARETKFQFFRPLSMLYVWLFMRPDGTFAIEALHVFQIGYHLVNILLAFLIALRLGLRLSTAVSVAALFAFYPFSYQAVAWAAPNQPMAALLQNSAWLLYFLIRPLPNTFKPPSTTRRRIYYGASLLCFFLALLVQESSVAVAFVPLLYEFIVRLPIHDWPSLRQILQTPRRSGWVWAFVYPLMGILYFIVWLVVPRLDGVTSSDFQVQNINYLVQGFIYPIIIRLNGYAANYQVNEWGLLITFGLTMLGLLLLARWRKRGRLALFAFAWSTISLLPFLAGLNFAYVNVASRLFYVSALGVALLWASALWPTPRRAEPVWLRLISIAAVLFICWQSGWVLQQFEQLWQEGTAHLNTAVSVLTKSGETDLFLNFPDRYTTKQEPFPVGYWGVTLSPVVVKLDDFSVVQNGVRVHSISLAMPWIDLEARDSSPLLVDMRGTILEANEMLAVAQNVDAVYLTRYDQNGRFTLDHIGAIHNNSASLDCAAGVLFDDTVCLHQVSVEMHNNQLDLITRWSTNKKLPPQLTIFAHYGLDGAPPITQQDGDTWGGTLPLAAWPIGAQIIDRRTIPFSNDDVTPKEVSLHIGLYDWVNGERLTAVNKTTNQPYPNNRVPVWP